MRVQFDTTKVYTSLAGNQELDSKGVKLGYDFVDYNGSRFVMVQNNFSAVTVARDVVAWNRTADSPWAISQFGEDNTAIHWMAGVICGAVAIGGYGWLQYKGRGTARTKGDGTAISIGDVLKLATGTFTAVKDVAYSTIPTYQNGFLIARAASSAADALIATSIHCQL